MCQRFNSDDWHQPSPRDSYRLAVFLQVGGVRLTPQRKIIYGVVAGYPGHICAEHILGVIKKRECQAKINLATVYRTLQILVSAGLILEHICPADRTVYEVASHGKHAHLWCKKCKDLLHLEPEWVKSFQDELLNERGFEVDVEKHPIIGLCHQCSDMAAVETGVGLIGELAEKQLSGARWGMALGPPIFRKARMPESSMATQCRRAR
jgi:Fur family transcriptional regulator, ferric uptake regulator